MLNWDRMLKDKTSIQQLMLLVEATRLCRENDRKDVYTAPIYEFAQEKWGNDKRWVDQHLETLKSTGLVYFEKSPGGIGNFHMTPQGFDAAYTFEEKRSDKAKRFVAVRDQILAWMHDQYLDGIKYPGPEQFPSSKSNDFLGSKFTETELQLGMARLFDDGYIKGTKMATGKISAPYLTSEGAHKAESGESVAVRSAPATLHHYDNRNYSNKVAIHDSPGAQAVAGSQHVTQTSTMTQHQLDSAREVSDGVRRLLPLLDLSDEKEQEALDLLEGLDAELESPAPDAGKGKELVAKIGEVAATSTVSSVVSMLGLMVQQFMGVI